MNSTSHRRSAAKRLAQYLCRVLASRPATRGLLNLGYDLLPVRSKAAFHRLFTEIFDEQDGRLVEGEWHVRFNGAVIRLPLRPMHARLDWTAAISILGHETEIKSTYAHLLANRDCPIDFFLDVGANFGTHSILFAASGVKVMAFEPNKECQEYSAAVGALNHVDIAWTGVALSDHQGEVNLVYPKHQTWLGSIEPDVSSKLPRTPEGCITSRVKLDILDRYASELPAGAHVLLKIDVEGGELSVLRGAQSLLQRKPTPSVIFESNETTGRADLANLLTGHGLHIFALPFPARQRGTPLSLADFAASTETNFIAVPAGR